MDNKQTLLDIRDELDVIDKEITRLYKKRIDLCAEVANVKIKSGKAVFDPAREGEKLDTVASYLDSDFDKKAIRELYQQLMTISRRLQLGIMAEHGKSFDTGFEKIEKSDKSGKRVVYQGAEGAYAQIAAIQCFGRDADISNVKTWKDAADKVRSGEADYAVLPIENSSHGVVSDNFDLMLKYPELAIIEEVDLKVAHALMSVKGATIEGIREIYSHPQALGQCSEFFEAHPGISAVPVLNTAVAAKFVRDKGDTTMAALASEAAAELYGLEILQRSVNQQKTNTTRFIIIGREKTYTDAAGKISLCFEAAHRPGALYNILGNFIFNDVNLTMISSRPIPERPFEYRFFVDIEGRLDMPNIVNALSGMEDQVTELRILGNY
ncbi:prephenate dehydratase [Oribacterium sp. WCC10]|uniref:prephenate dehydratase n=1 Tax=Oribacterium sp. WCC10 TaxID=1855343 RepID=UPI0008EB8D2B|nr:prephenate dehydratase [Oribacterium sp. WCC10]SFG39974.1 chorismate mutase / prephenate dehydratase [Oribacterium sp. WCC10]